MPQMPTVCLKNVLVDMNVTCKICRNDIATPGLNFSSPSITSVKGLVDSPLELFFCKACGHVQNEFAVNIEEYYADNYRISLESSDFDQLYEVVDGKDIYRTEYQARLIEKKVDIPENAKVLDFGAAKAHSLKQLCRLRGDIIPFVYDVGDSYQTLWDEFLPRDNQAVKTIPQNWDHSFDLITSHFVFEHLAEPLTVARELRKLLKPDGTLFISVPDALSNIGDYLTVDHLHHYSAKSLCYLLSDAGFQIESFDEVSFRGAFVVTATVHAGNKDTESKACDIVSIERALDRLTLFNSKIIDLCKNSQSISPDTAIFGAGFYGTYIYSKLRILNKISCFVDNNKHLAGGTFWDLPIYNQDNIPDTIDTVLIGVNPEKASEIVESISSFHSKRLIFF